MNWLKFYSAKIAATLVVIFSGLCFSISQITPAIAQSKSATPNSNSALTIRADSQEANSKTGVVTAKGNVLMNYPARAIVATSTQAQYFSKERRIILTGNVIVTQQGNKIVAETITYLIDEGKFEAKPESNRQVESTYIVPDETTTTTPVKLVKPSFKSPVAPIKAPDVPIKTPDLPGKSIDLPSKTP
jgi:lipopolysaccharide export system protein LptA